MAISLNDASTEPGIPTRLSVERENHITGGPRLPRRNEVLHGTVSASNQAPAPATWHRGTGA